jgi:tagatose 6-phosphate kinase
VILAAGLTPAWQQILRLDQFRPGEVNRARETVWCASGKVINVGLALAGLGAPVKTLAPLGGWSGAAIEQEFAQAKLEAEWIPSATPTRVCTTLLDAATGVTTELVQNAGPLTYKELAASTARYRETVRSAEMVVLSGSLPQGTPPSYFRDWLRATPCPAVLDIRGPELLACLELKARVVKPNREELAATLGKSLPDRPALLEAMREILQRGAQAIVVTQGKAPVLVAQGSDLWEFSPPPVADIVNPIGCGDCLAAGLAWGLAQGRSLVDAVQIGMAAAAENLSQLLPARIGRWKQSGIMK